MTHEISNPVVKRCAQCGREFRCGCESDWCWCVEMPALPAEKIDRALDCLCPECLRNRSVPPPSP